ncbi:MAG: hypothetical protein JXX29_11310 [Deltaproteobacteria bacterium]|nr:hypothetical protein [Deltaproteobacteria bacterium]MBN2672259.1 hypothetical protein [Deltaproteobacteria bacterium]
MSYAIAPGLYGLGEPTRNSPVVVTANYKLSFDHLRRHLAGRNVWILVLNTYGINVWCAAGKGTFGTEELIARIRKTQLADRVDTRKIILPQLGAPGVAAHSVKAQTGFQVKWGPVEAADLGAYIDADHKATPRMREKRFPLKERLVLIPIELRPALKVLLYILAIASPLAALAFPGAYLNGVVHYVILLAMYMSAGVLSGAVLTPLLLPFLPGRAFSMKSIWVSIGVLVPLGLAMTNQIDLTELIGLSFISAGIAAYAAMNFTGASTYTSLSGVKKEMRLAVPVEIASTALGVGIWLYSQIAA